MDIQQISMRELDAVVGGMMNNGQGDLVPKAPGAVPPRGNPGPPDAPFDNKWAGGLAILGLGVAIVAGL